MEKNKEFRPYVPQEHPGKELTLTSLVAGVILAVVFGAANAYLGLRVGMTVSASIPAAVISMGVIRVLLKRKSILESNIVQTIGSAGESLAAGTIFTLPALFLWASEGRISRPDIITITSIALVGGLFGVLFMIPLRRALIVKEHGVLPYPEGKACAEVLLSGEDSRGNSGTVFAGMGIGAVAKLVVDGLRLALGEISLTLRRFAMEIGIQVYPAIFGVGYICGPGIASYMFAGGLLSWLVFIPLIVLFGRNTVIYPGTHPIGFIYDLEGASGIWSTYIRYVGAGALATGGIISLIKSFPLIGSTFAGVIKGASGKENIRESRTTRDLSFRVVIGGIIVLTICVWTLPHIPVSLPGAVMVVVFGFFFAAVSSRMVGLVGSSSNPVSGMSIATILLTSLLLKSMGYDGMNGMVGAISVGSVICIISAIAGDTSQDLKTGYILGATPQKQQLGEVVGVLASSLAIGGTLYLLDLAWGFGSKELGAPQATLMKLISEGVMNGNLPWALVITGVFTAVFVELLGVPVLPVAIGIYLPVHLSACIAAGGMVRLFADKIKGSEKMRNYKINSGILFSSGMIAGEGIVGILLAILAVFGLDSYLDIRAGLGIPEPVAIFFGVLVFAAVIIFTIKFSMFKRYYEE